MASAATEPAPASRPTICKNDEHSNGSRAQEHKKWQAVVEGKSRIGGGGVKVEGGTHFEYWPIWPSFVLDERHQPVTTSWTTIAIFSFPALLWSGGRRMISKRAQAHWTSRRWGSTTELALKVKEEESTCIWLYSSEAPYILEISVSRSSAQEKNGVPDDPLDARSHPNVQSSPLSQYHISIHPAATMRGHKNTRARNASTMPLKDGTTGDDKACDESAGLGEWLYANIKRRRDAQRRE
ncbi:hypothetical protein ARMSODRAFT_979461 [Armillaria solidipes]|uniref:Uncharacterized protein n=1 Tax=Armillaria solidipes TaxID=1076256 RepID=A0A2H3BM14_9AGAR|nr:hypothetical protein ARMSODRAFT_979461 [Armillaria solidipes]